MDRSEGDAPSANPRLSRQRRCSAGNDRRRRLPAQARRRPTGLAASPTPMSGRWSAVERQVRCLVAYATLDLSRRTRRRRRRLLGPCVLQTPQRRRSTGRPPARQRVCRTGGTCAEPRTLFPRVRLQAMRGCPPETPGCRRTTTARTRAPMSVAARCAQPQRWIGRSPRPARCRRQDPDHGSALPGELSCTDYWASATLWHQIAASQAGVIDDSEMWTPPV